MGLPAPTHSIRVAKTTAVSQTNSSCGARAGLRQNRASNKQNGKLDQPRDPSDRMRDTRQGSIKQVLFKLQIHIEEGGTAINKLHFLSATGCVLFITIKHSMVFHLEIRMK